MDTIRTLAELNALLADNDSADISPQDIRDLMISQMVHAEIGAVDNANITLGAGFQTVDLDTAGAAKRGADVDTITHRITSIPVVLKATVHYEIEFKGTAGGVYEFKIFRNGGPSIVLGTHRRVYVPSADAIVQRSATVTTQLAQDETLEIAVKSSGNDFELLSGVLRIERIGVE